MTNYHKIWIYKSRYDYICMLKEFKSGTIFYKNKRWKIDYFPKK